MPDYFNRGRYNGANTPDEMDGEENRRMLFAAIGREAPEWRDEQDAPEVTDELRERIRRFVREELSPAESTAVLVLSLRYRSIANEVSKINGEEFRRGNN